MADFFRFENRTTIKATLRMETALSVGSRTSFLPAGSDLPVMKTPEGIPYIPGSSLKGVVRAYTERLLRTMDTLEKKYQGQRVWACDPLDTKKCCVPGDIKKKLFQEAKEVDAEFTSLLYKESCTACRLFGSPWLASRVAFQDAFLQNASEMLRLTEIRDGVGIDRDLGTAKTNVKYDFETVPAGACFGITIVVENATGWEVGLLLLALEAMRKGELPLGGKTTRGVGWGKLEEITVQRIEESDILLYLAGQKEPETLDPKDLIGQFTGALR
ncbi:MAG: CRISPR-associated RAMP protein [Candidatus Atribacteria bacterium]|nr:CRISPR-associated RAMP protein [Candidatus Atribacteria bacterium]